MKLRKERLMIGAGRLRQKWRSQSCDTVQRYKSDTYYPRTPGYMFPPEAWTVVSIFREKVFIIESIIKQFEPFHKCDRLKNDKRLFFSRCIT